LAKHYTTALTSDATATFSTCTSMNNLDELEMVLTCMHCGYLYRQRSRCSGRERSWCALDSLGSLTIGGSLIADLTQKDIHKSFYKAKDTSEHIWHIRDSRGSWGTIEVDPREGPGWTEAFELAQLLGGTLRHRDIAFAGVIRKLHQHGSLTASAATATDAPGDGEEDPLPTDFQLREWPQRIMVLSKNGDLCGYWGDDSQATRVVLANVLAQDDVLMRMECEWICHEFIVPFKVHTDEGRWCYLAAAPEDVHALFKQVAIMQRNASEGVLPKTFSRSRLGR